MKKFTERCRNAVEDFMVSKDMISTNLDDLEKLAKYGAASFTILVGIAAIAVVFGLSMIGIAIVLYAILNGIVTAIGIDELTSEIPDNLEERREEIEKELEELKKILK